MSLPTPTSAPAQEATSIGASISAYQALPQSTLTPGPGTGIPASLTPEHVKDVTMMDGNPERPASPAILPGANNAPSPQPPRTSTPLRMVNGGDSTSRATSQHPDPAPTMPKEAPPHGAPTRQYLNSKVTGVVMDGMKLIAKERPANPLQVLGEYLMLRSKEIEGT